LLECQNIRNFGIIAHIDAGKTTTTERILYLCGTTYKIGEVDEGTTITDWMEEEKNRGITITSAAVSCTWKDSIFHIIDTPGHVDFTAEVQRSLRVLDGAVVVFCGVAGVQTQSETVWKQADLYKIPRIIYINKLDRVGANFENAISDIKKKLNVTPVAISIPYFKNDNLLGVIDIIKMKKIIFSETGEIDTIENIPDDYNEIAEKYREELINIITSFDDKLLEKALEGNITEEAIISSMRAGTIQRNYIPVIAGTSLKNIGVPLLLNAIDNFLPSPDDIGSIKALYVKRNEWDKLKFDPNSDTVAYIFKVQFHREKGPLAFIRLYSGKLKNGDNLYNPRVKKRERIQDLLKIYADKFERLESISAGDIVTVSGLKNIGTGDTLCTENNQVVLESLKFPEPVIYVKVEAKNAIDKEKLNTAKQNLLIEDPTITYREDQDTGQTLIGGMGELHIQILLERIKKVYGIELKSGSPQVAYKETPKKAGEYLYEFDKKIEGNVQHVKIKLDVEALERNTGNIIENNLHKKDKEFLSYIEKGISESLKSGPEGAYPVIDCKVIIESIDYDSSKTTPLAFEAAANLCTSYLLREVETNLLEPIMKLEIDVPSNFTGTVMGELQSRNGTIIDILKKINQDIIIAKAPLKVMFGYTTTLRSQTQGKGSFTMEFLEFDIVG
jgi:elongation factor G